MLIDLSQQFNPPTFEAAAERKKIEQKGKIEKDGKIHFLEDLEKRVEKVRKKFCTFESQTFFQSEKLNLTFQAAGLT